MTVSFVAHAAYSLSTAYIVRVPPLGVNANYTNSLLRLTHVSLVSVRVPL